MLIIIIRILKIVVIIIIIIIIIVTIMINLNYSLSAFSSRLYGKVNISKTLMPLKKQIINNFYGKYSYKPKL